MVEPRHPHGNLKPVVHGGIRRREIEAMGLEPLGIVDFSASVNPYGPPAGIRRALHSAVKEIASYPDPWATDLEEAIARKVGCDPSEVLAGAGSTQLIHILSLVYARRDKRVLIPAHTYGEYEAAVRAAGGRVDALPMPGLQLSGDEIAFRVQDADLLFICNPNNPTGQYLPPREMERVADACREVGCLLVMDEAFRDFLAESSNTVAWALDSGGIILLRSFTKIYGIPGVRVGYAVGDSHLLEPLRRLRPPWSVDTFAQAAATAALQEDDFVVSSRRKLWRHRRLFERFLKVLPSNANFFLLRVGNAAVVRRELLPLGFLVRDCTSFGLPEYIRFAVRRPRENQGLVEALTSVAPDACGA